MTKCHQVVCNKGMSSSFYQNHPTDLARLCSSRNGEMVSHMRNLPSRYETNLCKQAPYIPKKCSLSHGMLMALEGQSVPNLYASSILRHRDDIVESAGAGLFFKGGNPVYYTAKGSSEDVASQVHSVLRGSMQDVGGHHIVFKVFKEPWTGTRFMRVDRAPLVAADIISSNGAEDPAVHMYRSSLKSSTTMPVTKDGATGDSYRIAGWLSNLAGDMRLEQNAFRADALHPTSPKKTSWSCPLRRMSFWSKVTGTFSPLAPSPGRSGRIFGTDSGRDMQQGTRAHPTQRFSSLYPKLANVLTSNGFCVCVDWQDCQVGRRLWSIHSTCQMRDRLCRTRGHR